MNTLAGEMLQTYRITRTHGRWNSLYLLTSQQPVAPRHKNTHVTSLYLSVSLSLDSKPDSSRKKDRRDMKPDKRETFLSNRSECRTPCCLVFIKHHVTVEMNGSESLEMWLYPSDLEPFGNVLPIMLTFIHPNYN